MSDLSTYKRIVQHLKELCEEDVERHSEAQCALQWARAQEDAMRGLYLHEPTYDIDPVALEKNVVEQFNILFPFLVNLVRPTIEFPGPSNANSFPTVAIAKMSAVDRLGNVL